VIHVFVVALHAVPLKLYAVECNHTHAQSLAHAIVKLHALHSFPFEFENVYVGAVISFVYVCVSTKLVLQLFNESHDIAFNVVVATLNA